MPRSRQQQGANVSFFAFQDIITAVTGILILIVILMVLMLRQPGVVAKIQTEPVETRSLDEIESLIAEALEKIRDLAQLDLPSADETEGSLLAEIAALEEKLEAETDPLRAALLSDVEAAMAEVETLKQNLSDLVEEHTTMKEARDEAKKKVKKRISLVEESREGSQIWLRMNPADKDPVIVELDHRGAVLRDRENPDLAKRLSPETYVSELRRIAQEIDGLETYFVFFIRPSGTEFLSPLREMLTEEGIDLGFRPLAEDVELKIFNPEAEIFEE